MKVALPASPQPSILHNTTGRAQRACQAVLDQCSHSGIEPRHAPWRNESRRSGAPAHSLALQPSHAPWHCSGNTWTCTPASPRLAMASCCPSGNPSLQAALAAAASIVRPKHSLLPLLNTSEADHVASATPQNCKQLE